MVWHQDGDCPIFHLLLGLEPKGWAIMAVVIHRVKGVVMFSVKTKGMLQGFLVDLRCPIIIKEISQKSVYVQGWLVM